MTRPPPLVLETDGLQDYALIDSGNGRKLERFGALTLDRPEEQAIWRPRLPETAWQKADAVFTGDVEEEGAGRWKRRAGLAEDWTCRHGAIRFSCRFTSFRHVGAFPEQEAHWSFVRERLRAAGGGAERPSLLNLFGYTGLASLIAAEAGAEVTHVDASKKAIAWARDNQALSGLDDKPIRWILDDAVKFAARDVRRGRRYDGVLLDPPKYGRGPKGEVWDLFQSLPEMLTLCRDLVKPGGFLILTAYAIRASFLSMERLCTEIFGAGVEAGELALRQEGGGLLPTSLFCRWTERS
jgi:23S rRNA (cytosine1962-C5)-methyltransferase